MKITLEDSLDLESSNSNNYGSFNYSPGDSSTEGDISKLDHSPSYMSQPKVEFFSDSEDFNINCGDSPIGFNSPLDSTYHQNNSTKSNMIVPAFNSEYDFFNANQKRMQPPMLPPGPFLGSQYLDSGFRQKSMVQQSHGCSCSDHGNNNRMPQVTFSIQNVYECPHAKTNYQSSYSVTRTHNMISHSLNPPYYCTQPSTGFDHRARIQENLFHGNRVPPYYDQRINNYGNARPHYMAREQIIHSDPMAAIQPNFGSQNLNGRIVYPRPSFNTFKQVVPSFDKEKDDLPVKEVKKEVKSVRKPRGRKRKAVEEDIILKENEPQVSYKDILDKEVVTEVELGDSDFIDTVALCKSISKELKTHNIAQSLFAKKILCRSQGTLSDLLRNPKPWNKLKGGKETFKRMVYWMSLPLQKRLDTLKDTTGVNFYQSHLGPPTPASNGRSADNSSHGSKDKKRLVFTGEQKSMLWDSFLLNNRPTREAQDVLAKKLGLSKETVGNYFMNARRRSSINLNTDDASLKDKPDRENFTFSDDYDTYSFGSLNNTQD
uniref:One cut domain family member n=1 Tax=Rhabditophanes sp. KR3021 TaxID=114890 RepID=A0AC35TKW9_9BILA